MVLMDRRDPRWEFGSLLRPSGRSGFSPRRFKISGKGFVLLFVFAVLFA